MITHNKSVITLMGTYPTDGTHKYHWVNGFDGVTHDLVYKGEVVAKSEAEKRTYCCGLTFELFFRTAVASEIDLGTISDVRRLKREWFVSTGKRKGPVDALVPKLGIEVKLEEALPGDFMQIWRKNGSGHSVVFVSHEGNKLTYWSTQPATNGIGVRTESLDLASKNPVTEIYIARLISTPQLDDTRTQSNT